MVTHKKTIHKKVTRKLNVKKGVLAKLVKDVKHLKVVENTLKTVDYYTNPSGAYDVLTINGLCYALHSTVANNTSGTGPLVSLRPSLVYKRIKLRLNFEWKTTATGVILPPIGATVNYGTVRCIVFADMDSDQANPPILGASGTESVLDNDLAVGVTTNYILPRNRAMMKRYKVFHDKEHKFLNTTGNFNITVSKSFKNHTAYYESSNPGVANYINGQLFLILIPSDSFIINTGSGTGNMAVAIQSVLDYER